MSIVSFVFGSVNTLFSVYHIPDKQKPECGTNKKDGCRWEGIRKLSSRKLRQKYGNLERTYATREVFNS